MSFGEWLSIIARSELGSDLDCSDINGMSELGSHLDCFELKGDEKALNDDGKALMCNGYEALTGDERRGSVKCNADALKGDQEALNDDAWKGDE